MRFASRLVIALLLLCAPAFAQSANTFHVFPQFADGVFADGSSYRSTLMIQPSFSLSAVNCNLTLHGMTTSFSAGIGSSFAITVPANGWTQMRTAGTQAYQGGYATLTCSDFVAAQVLYTFYIRGAKVSEATVFSSSPSLLYSLLADQTENARLGVAIANDTDLGRTYQIKLVTSTGATYATGT